MQTTLNIDEAIVERLYAEAKRRGTTASALAEAGILHILDEEPASQTAEDLFEKLPTWNSGGELVDITNREELYRVMDEYDGTLDLYRRHPLSRGVQMADLNNDEIQALAKAVGLTLSEPELSQVTHSLNAMLEEMAAINPPGFNLEEYLAVTHPADMEVAE